MKTRQKALVAVAILASLASLAAMFRLILPPVIFVGFMHHHMMQGVNCMDSIGHADLPYWTAQTRSLLQRFKSDELREIREGIPKDLADKGIIRIDIDGNIVRYVWLGGMDHTYLEVEKKGEGTFTLRGHYADGVEEKLLATIKGG